MPAEFESGGIPAAQLPPAAGPIAAPSAPPPAPPMQAPVSTPRGPITDDYGYQPAIAYAPPPPPPPTAYTPPAPQPSPAPGPAATPSAAGGRVNPGYTPGVTAAVTRTETAAYSGVGPGAGSGTVTAPTTLGIHRESGADFPTQPGSRTAAGRLTEYLDRSGLNPPGPSGPDQYQGAEEPGWWAYDPHRGAWRRDWIQVPGGWVISGSAGTGAGVGNFLGFGSGRQDLAMTIPPPPSLTPPPSTTTPALPPPALSPPAPAGTPAGSGGGGGSAPLGRLPAGPGLGSSAGVGARTLGGRAQLAPQPSTGTVGRQLPPPTRLGSGPPLATRWAPATPTTGARGYGAPTPTLPRRSGSGAVTLLARAR